MVVPIFDSVTYLNKYIDYIIVVASNYDVSSTLSVIYKLTVNFFILHAKTWNFRKHDRNIVFKRVISD